MEDHHYYGTNNSDNNNNNNNGNPDISTVIHGGDIEFSNQELQGTMDTILDDLLRDTHAPNHHHHTNDLQAEMLSSPNNEEKTSETDQSTQLVERSNRNKRPRHEKGDNKEAVRRYRDKLKAREAALQEEVTKLKASNQELLNKLQTETAMQDEIYMLKCLLVDIRSRIDGEIHSFRHFRPSSINSGYKHHGVQHQQCNNEHRSRIAGKSLQPGQMFYDDYGQHGGNPAVFDNFNPTTPTLPSLPNKFLNFKGDV